MIRKKLLTIILVICLILILSSGYLFIVQRKGETITSNQQNALIQNDNYVEILESYTSTKIVDFDSAKKSIIDVADKIGIQEVKNELKNVNINLLDNLCFFRFNQEYKGLDVIGKSIIVIADEFGNSKGVVSTYIPLKNQIDTNPKIQGNEFIENVKEYLNNQYQFSKDSITINDTNLCIDAIYSDELRLSYNANIIATEDGHICSLTVFADANTGDVYHCFDNINNYSTLVKAQGQDEEQSIYAQQDNNTILLVNDAYQSEGGPILSVYTPKLFHQADWYEDDNSQIVSWKLGSQSNQSAVDAMGNVSKSYEFYKNVLERNSVDGNGKDIEIYVDVVAYKNSKGKKVEFLDNACYWKPPIEGINKSIIAFSKRSSSNQNQYSAYLDCTAHEFTHGVVTSIVGDYLETSINESYADILGSCIEGYYSNNMDWIISEINRYAIAPNQYISGSDNIPYPSNMEEYSDEYDPHTNATILYHCAYLMYSGIENKMTAIDDIQKLSKIWYLSLMFLSEDAQIENVRQAVDVAARLLIDNGLLNSNDLETIRSAFDEVGIKVENDENNSGNPIEIYNDAVNNMNNINELNEKCNSTIIGKVVSDDFNYNSTITLLTDINIRNMQSNLNNTSGSIYMKQFNEEIQCDFIYSQEQIQYSFTKPSQYNRTLNEVIKFQFFSLNNDMVLSSQIDSNKYVFVLNQKYIDNVMNSSGMGIVYSDIYQLSDLQTGEISMEVEINPNSHLITYIHYIYDAKYDTKINGADCSVDASYDIELEYTVY